MIVYPVGTRVRLLTPNEPYTGQVGAVMEHFDDGAGGLVHILRYNPDEPPQPQNLSFHLADELEPE
ncbi:hypothetical protein [Mycobacterium sp. SMC-14]|uniref:hypothetical protein n=1 Tax=Mycobacterium sp. SMC-14 TaxID=3385968 RepID=UPI00390CA994